MMDSYVVLMCVCYGSKIPSNLLSTYLLPMKYYDKLHVNNKREEMRMRYRSIFENFMIISFMQCGNIYTYISVQYCNFATCSCSATKVFTFPSHCILCTTSSTAAAVNFNHHSFFHADDDDDDQCRRFRHIKSLCI